MNLKREEIEFFVLSETDESVSNDVPFYNEYVKGTDSLGIKDLEGCYVQQAFRTDKGLLLIGERFKYFVFLKTEMYGFITEYFLAYPNAELLGPRLVMFPSTRSKALLGVSKSDPLCYWDAQKTCYNCTLPTLMEKSVAKEKKRTKPNPLLS